VDAIVEKISTDFCKHSDARGGLVLFTVIGLAITAGSLLPGFDWKSAVLLRAVVAATDAIAATSIARRVGLPQSIVHILEAESLVNDGTGLLALQFGLTILITGRTPSIVEGVGKRVFLIGGVFVGLAIGGVIALFEKWVDDGPIEIVISILVPYAAYLMRSGARLGRHRGDCMRHVYEPEESGVHVTASAVADVSSMGRADFCAERNRVCGDWVAASVCDGSDRRAEPPGTAALRNRL
jgi:hypothetical protein